MPNSFLDFAFSTPVVAAEDSGSLPRVWLGTSVQAAAGVFVPYLPEPRSTDSGRGSRSEVFARHVSAFSRAFQRVVQLLSDPHVLRESVHDRDRPFWTFDLRICSGGLPGSIPVSGHNAPELGDPPRIVMLIKGVVETKLGRDAAEVSLRVLHSELNEFVSRFRSLVPNDLTT